MSDEPKRRSQATGLSRTCMSVTLFTFVVLAAHYLPAQQPSPKPITLAMLVDVMEAREKLVDSVMVRWTQNERYRAGALIADPREYTFACEMLLKGSSMRYVTKTFWHHAPGDVDLIDHVSCYDGNESKWLQGSEPPQGRISTEKANTDARTSSLLPLRLYFRPLAEPYATLKRNSLRLLDERKTIDGHECVTVDDGYLRVDLDRDRDFVPVAFQTHGKNLVVHFDGKIEYYRNQGRMQWIPKGFEVKSHGGFIGQGLPDRMRGDGIQTTIETSFKKSDFGLNFKPGTVVWDARTREEYRIRNDGSKEPIERRRRKRAAPK